MSDEALSLSSKLSIEEGKNSPSKKAQKRKSSDLSSNDSKEKENLPKKKRKIQSESLDRHEHGKKVVKPQYVAKIEVPTPNADDGFQNFMKICLEKRSDDDTKRVLQKLQKLYNKLNSYHKSDEKFKSYIAACLKKITKNLSKDIYTPMLELRTEIKNRIQTKLQDEVTTAAGVSTEELSKKKMRQIEALEESIRKCRMKIKELQEKEVDFDEDQDSAYIQEDKYKRKLVQLCNYLSEITGDKDMRKQIFKTKIRRKDIPGDMTGNLLLDEAVICLINSGIGKINKLKYLETQGCADLVKMLDYVDVLRCIKECNKDSNLDLSEEKMTKLAKRAFKDLGNFLKNKRINDSKQYLQSLIPDESKDPAEKDVHLRQKLQKNKTDGDKRLNEIFKKYLDKQDGVDEEGTEEQTERNSDNVNKDKDKTSCLHSDRKNENNSTEKDKSYRKKKEILVTSTVAKTSFIQVHQTLKSKETLKNNANTDTANKTKETLKDNIVKETTSKSKETLNNNAVSDTTLKLKEAVKDTALKPEEISKNNAASETALTSKETLEDNTITETALHTKEVAKGNTVVETSFKSKDIPKINVIPDTAPIFKETSKDKAASEKALESNEILKEKAASETVFKSKETLRKNAASATAPNSKDNLKDNTVTEKALKSQEAVKQNTGTGAALKSKEVVKNITVIEAALKSEETLKDNTVEETIQSCNSKNEIINEKRENFEKTAQIDNKEDDDVVIIDSSDDDCVEVDSPCDVKKIAERKLPSISTKTEPKRMVKVDIESSQLNSPAITSTPMKTVQHNILPKKLVDVAKVDNNKIQVSFLKVREFAKPPPAWLDDGSIQSPWLSGG